MISSYKSFWSNITNFSGVTNRPDYWWPTVINYFVALILISFISGANGGITTDITKVVAYIVVAIVWLGTLTLKVRRMHDTDRSGWWIFIDLVPVVGTIWFLVLTLLPSKDSRWN